MISKLSNSSLLSKAYYKNMLVGNPSYVPPAYELISSVIEGGFGSSTVTFSGIPTSTYKHLQLRIVTRVAGDFNGIKMQFNSDTASNYSFHALQGDGSSVSSNASTSNDGIIIYGSPTTGNESVANGAYVIDILDAFNTSKYTTIRSLSGSKSSFTRVSLTSGNWRNTAAVTTITFKTVDGAAVAPQYSRYSLYGIVG